MSVGCCKEIRSAGVSRVLLGGNGSDFGSKRRMASSPFFWSACCVWQTSDAERLQESTKLLGRVSRVTYKCHSVLMSWRRGLHHVLLTPVVLDGRRKIAHQRHVRRLLDGQQGGHGSARSFRF